MLNFKTSWESAPGIISNVTYNANGLFTLIVGDETPQMNC